MTVPEDDYVRYPLFDESLLRGAQFLDGGKLVAYEEGAPLNDGQTLIRKAHGIGIVVTAHGDDWRNFFQLPDQFLVAYVSGMDDMTNAREQLKDLFVQFTVCIGDDADERRVSAHHESILEAKVCIVSTSRTAMGG